MIPRQTLFGNPHRSTVRISPDGKSLAYLADHDGVMNVWVAPVDDLSNCRVVTHDRTTGISQYFWAYTSEHILYLQDNDGDEDFHLYRVDLAQDQVLDLTPFQEITAQVNHVSHRHPNEILVGVNDRDEHWFHDIYRINIIDGSRERIEENNQYLGFIADDDYRLKIAIALTPESDMVLLKREDDDWEPWVTIDSAEVMTTSPIGLDQSGQRLLMLDTRGRDTAAIKYFDLASEQEELIFATEVADVNGVMTHPTELTVQAVSYTYERVTYEVLDPQLKPDFEYLEQVCDGEIEVVSQSLDQGRWIVAFSTDDGPVRYYDYQRTSKQARFLFSHRPELDELGLQKMHSMVIPARDGLKLVSYLTLPQGQEWNSEGKKPDQPLPMVLLVHGGPWARDYWGYNPLHQLLANRGYAVLSVNYRGSTGFGKNFINAANMEWAGKMHDDLIDAVQWAIDAGIADADKVAIMGGSYGGYAALVGLTFTPEIFACGIDIVGPSSLITLMENPPPYWMPIMPLMTTRVGDFSSEEGRAFLQSRSPLFHVDKITKPLLIGQGANDPRVKQTESDQIVAALNSKQIPVTYVLYPEEGHGFDRPENDISFYAICESFLARELGGSAEPIGTDFQGANFEVSSGLEEIPGLAEGMLALKSER